MIKTFTQNDLIRFIYHETTEEEEKELKRALLCDPVLKESYNELRETIRSMDQAQLEPSEKTVASILSYSQKTVAKKSTSR